MKISHFIRYSLSAVLLLFSSFSYSAGLLKPSNSALPDLQIREHHVEVTIENGYVVTSVEQVFFNPNDSDLEAIYSFPVPESAAVGEFTYWIDGKAVIAEVIEKQKAREIYEIEKSAGRQTAIVEQDSFKTFDISVYPVRASDKVRIRLVYLQSAHLDLGIGRYVYPLENGGVDELKDAFWTRNEIVSEKFSFTLDFRSSYAIDALRLPKHPHATVQQVSAQEWRAHLINQTNPEETQTSSSVITLDQDIVVYWRQVEGLPGSIDLISYKDENQARGTFMLNFNPGDDLSPITQGSDWTFVLDISGSMQGKYATLVEGVRQGLNKLRSDDRFRIILFNEQAINLSGSFQNTTPENVSDALQKLENWQVGGGTNLYAGLSRGLNNLQSDRPSGVILVTDGVANVGTTERKAFLELLEKYDVRLFTFVMGNSADRPMLQQMAKVSQGFAMSVSNADDIVGQILLASSKLTHQAYRDIELSIDGVRVKDLSPEKIGSMYRGDQLSVFGHYWKGGDAKVRLKAKIGNEEKIYETSITFPSTDTRNPELERLWAFGTIENLQAKLAYLGADSDIEQAITDIAKEYGLVTEYTSMIVVEENVFQQLNIDRNNMARVENEQKARADRLIAPVQDNRADKSAPMYKNKRPTSSGGGGASDFLWVFLLTGLGLLKLRESLFNQNPN